MITMKLECHKIGLARSQFSTTSTIEGLGEDGTLNSTTGVQRTLCTFSTGSQRGLGLQGSGLKNEGSRAPRRKFQGSRAPHHLL